MLKKITLTLIVLFTCSVSYQSFAQGCVAIRYMPGVGMGNMHEGKKWQISLTHRYFVSYKHFRGDEHQVEREEKNTEVVNTSHSTDVSLTYAWNKKWSVTFGIPYIHNYRSSLYEHDGTRHSTKSRGIGDSRIVLNWWTGNPEKHHKRDVQIGFGIKIPTGDFYAKDAFITKTGAVYGAVDQSIQLGDGGWGFIGQSQFYHTWNRWTLFANGFYLANPRDTNGTPALGSGGKPRTDSLAVGAINHVMSVPDQYAVRVGASVLASEKCKLHFNLGLRLEAVPTWDLMGKSEGFRRPGMVLSVDPGLLWAPGNHQLSLNVPVAAYRNRTKNTYDIKTGKHGDAAFADYMVLLGYSYSF